jgi:predicted nicotinamide N-methyase
MPRIGSYDTAVVEVVVRGRRLRLLQPRSIEDLHERESPTPPYWAQVWPSALVLAGELETRDLAGLRVVELGCGLGVGAIAAALAGAAVLATDVDRDAVAFARENGRRALRRRLATMRVDLTDLPAELLALAPFDLVIAADVLYTEVLAAGLVRALATLVRPGTEALVAYAWHGQADGLGGALGWDATHREDGGARIVTLRRPA